MKKHHLIVLVPLLLAFAWTAAMGVSDTIVFQGKLLDNLTDAMISKMSEHLGVSLRFLDVSSADPKEIDILFFAPEGNAFYHPGDIYRVRAYPWDHRPPTYPWRSSSYLADTTREPLICDRITRLSPSSHVLKDSGIKKLSVFTGNWHAWNTDSADKGKIFADFTCQFSPNGQYLIADRVVTNHGAVTNVHSIYSYNKNKDDYSLTVIGVPGEQPFTVPIAYEGDSLIYYGEYTDKGKKMYARTLDIFLSPVSYIFLVQSSENGWCWHTNSEGRATKAHPPEMAKP